MKTYSISIFPLLLILSTSISQKCESSINHQPTSKQCPINSFCNQKQYCQCSPGWALSCQTPSTLLQQEKTEVQLSQNPLYFTIIPKTTDSIYVYRFQICSSDNNNDSINLHLALYADQGKQTTLDSSNFIGQQWLSIESSSCSPIYSPYMEFGSQENGQNEQMILKVSFANATMLGNLRKKQKEFTSQIRTQNVKLELSVMQIYVIEITTIWTIVIVFLSVLLLSFLGGIAFCLRAIRRIRLSPPQKNFFTDNNLDHFDELLPKTKLDENDTRIAQTCSICLLDFQTNDQIRETFCLHIFHHDCLDVWCKINLTCPVCRNSLKKEQLQTKKDMQINMSQVLQEDNEESLAEALSSPESKINMRKKLITHS